MWVVYYFTVWLLFVIVIRSLFCGVWVFNNITEFSGLSVFITLLWVLWCMSFQLHHSAFCGVWFFDSIIVCFVECVSFGLYHCVYCDVWLFDYIIECYVVCEFVTSSLYVLWCVRFRLHHCVLWGVWVRFQNPQWCSFQLHHCGFCKSKFSTTSLCVVWCDRFRLCGEKYACNCSIFKNIRVCIRFFKFRKYEYTYKL